MNLQLDAIDHIHVYVTDKQKAVEWYEEVLGLKPLQQYAVWDTKHGPLTIANDAGSIHLALFELASFEPMKSVAFKVSGEAFLQWRQHLLELDLLKRCVDHQLTWSMYFDDPFGHNYEITTHDIERVKQALDAEKQAVN